MLWDLYQQYRIGQLDRKSITFIRTKTLLRGTSLCDWRRNWTA